MDELKAFLKGLGSEEERVQFAERCGTSLGHLRNCISDRSKRIAAATCVAIEAESGKRVMRWHLRRDDWHLIWPELKSRRNAPAPNTAHASL